MIPPTALREALSAAFASESRFKVGEMVNFLFDFTFFNFNSPPSAAV